MFDGDTLAFRGRIESDNGASELELSVEGDTYTLSLDSDEESYDFGEIDLPTGNGVIVASIEGTSEDSDEESEIVEMVIDRNELLGVAADLEIQGDNLYFAEVDSLTAIDINTGDRNLIVSDPELFSDIQALIVNGDSAFAVDAEFLSLYSIDLTTGVVRVVSSNTVGVGPGLELPRVVIPGIDGTTIIVADAGLQSLVEIDLNSGDRTIIFSAFTVAGSIIREPVAMARTTNGQILVLDSAWSSLFLIDPDLSTYLEISGSEVGSGPMLMEPKDMVVDLDLITVLDAGYSGLMNIDLNSGARTLFAEVLPGSEHAFSEPESIVRNADYFYVADNGLPGVTSLDAETLERAVVTSSGLGTGVRMVDARDAVTTEDAYYAIDRAVDGLIEIDEDTSARTVVLDEDDLQDFIAPRGMVYDRVARRIYISHAGGVAEFDPEDSSSRDLLSDVGESGDLALDHDNGVLYVIDEEDQSLIALNLESRNRTEVVDELGLSGVGKLAFDSTDDIIYLLDVGDGHVYEVDTSDPVLSLLTTDLEERQPVDLDFDSVSGNLIVLSDTADRLWRLDPETGSADIISMQPGELMRNPLSIDVNPDDETLTLVDGDTQAVILYDLVSDYHVIVSM